MEWLINTNKKVANWSSSIFKGWLKMSRNWVDMTRQTWEDWTTR